MLIPKKNRREVYKYLFKGRFDGCAFLPPGFRINVNRSHVLIFAEGVLFAEKDFNLPAHPELPEIPNLQVRSGWRCFVSKGHFLMAFGHAYRWYSCI